MPKKHSAGYINHIAVVCISTEPFEYTKLTLPQHSKHQKTDQYWGSVNRCELDLNSDVNRPDSDKLREYTIVSSQFVKLP